MYANGPKIVTDGLVLCLDAANRKSYPGSGSTWYDLSGNGNNGNIENGVIISNGYASYDGSNDGVDIPRVYPGSLSITSNVTLEAFINYSISANNTGWMIVIDDMGNSPYTSYSLWISSNTPNKLLASYDSNNWKYSTGSIPPNEWNHIALSKNGASGKFYINGQDAGSITYTNLVNFTLETTTGTGIGRHKNNTGYPFNGKIAFAKVYNRALSDQEIQQNYNALKGRYGLT
jgi:hypothetical protein